MALRQKLNTIENDLQITGKALEKLKESKPLSEKERNHLDYFPRYFKSVMNFGNEIEGKADAELKKQFEQAKNKAVEYEKRIVRLLVIQKSLDELSKLNLSGFTRDNIDLRFIAFDTPQEESYYAYLKATPKKSPDAENAKNNLSSTRYIYFKISHSDNRYSFSGGIEEVLFVPKPVLSDDFEPADFKRPNNPLAAEPTAKPAAESDAKPAAESGAESGAEPSEEELAVLEESIGMLGFGNYKS